MASWFQSYYRHYVFYGKSPGWAIVSRVPGYQIQQYGKGYYFFNGNDGLEFKRGDPIPVRYRENDPSDARINRFVGIWVDTLINASIPLLILIVVFLHPDLIPKNSKIIIGKKPFIKTVGAKDFV